MAATNNARSLHFGAFSLDLRALELTKGGTRIRVPEQSLQILAMLLERPGEMVAREELHAKLWPNGTIVEFEHSINAAMNRLRVALGDSAEEPRFIETLPRRGYRFIFPVEPQAAGEVAAIASAPDTPAPGDLTGQTVSHYRVLEKLGQGAMGVVYKAQDLKLGRTVALKFLAEELSDSPQARERFQREARAVSSLNHPHICTLHDIGHQDGVDFLVMEYLAGETLAHRLRKGRLPADQVLQFAIQITDALEAAHRHGVTHRDLKPGNIMLTKSGAKLLDFGLAKVRASETAAATTALPTETALTGEGTLLGTLQYMAPEQLEGKEADARTDIFALGAVIYEMASGRKAFEGKSQASLISAILTTEPPPISALQVMAPPSLDHVVRTCLAKEPDARWQSAHDVLLQLQWIRGAGSQAGIPRPTPGWKKRERLAWILAGCLLASLIAALTIARLRPVPEAPAFQFDVALPEKLSPTCPGPVVSPDGQYVSIVLGDESHSRIWLHSLRSLVTNPMPGTEGGNFPFWSPDSRQIGFSTESGLKKISLMGGAPQAICKLSLDGPGAWNQDGAILFSPGEDQPLYKVSAKGGEPSALTKLDASRHETGHWFPQFLPDGRHFIFRVSATKSEDVTYLGSLDSRDVKRIDNASANPVYAPPGYLIFTIGQSLMAQRLVVRKAELAGEPMALGQSSLAEPALVWEEGYARFSVSENGVLTYLRSSAIAVSGDTRTQLAWFDRKGKRLGVVGEPADYSSPAISPDGKKIAVAKKDPLTQTRDIWLIDWQRGASSRFTFDPSDDLNPAWSPDGARIAFTSDRKGHRDIYVKTASGSGEEQLVLESNENKNVEHWSSDGQYLLWGSDIEEWLFSFKEQKSLPLPKFTQDQGSFCPNGSKPPRWFAYTSGETGEPQVYVRSFAGALSGSGGKWQISPSGGIEPIWRGDGKELFYVSGNKLMAVEVNPDGESFQFGVSKQLFETPLPRAGVRRRYDVTSDGKRFLINAPVEVEKAPQSFRVVLNWQALLRR